MHALCLWAPLRATRVRGEERAVREGKLWSPKEYAKSTRGALALAMRWIDGMRDNPGAYCSLELWDNTDFPATESIRSRGPSRGLSRGLSHEPRPHATRQHGRVVWSLMCLMCHVSDVPRV